MPAAAASPPPSPGVHLGHVFNFLGLLIVALAIWFRPSPEPPALQCPAPPEPQYQAPQAPTPPPPPPTPPPPPPPPSVIDDIDIGAIEKTQQGAESPATSTTATVATTDEDLSDKFSVVIYCFSRPHNIFPLAWHYLQSPKVDIVFIRWAGPTPAPLGGPDLTWNGTTIGDGKIRIIRPQNPPDIGERWAPIEGMRTEYVLNTDDDTLYPLQMIHKLFAYAKKFPGRIVGPHVRSVDEVCPNN
eukprot:TRINITY_DN66421_c1_g1_i2.p1 TRINITY_DN66421_c1_g1~~TRINITY_DN66421_c1_g1_i2.p1  ORF type:complete len:243 (+),score=28.78 TRINITY_DN66421_c1_g1_i2:29-757(+)